jgi:hypothetical protein
VAVVVGRLQAECARAALSPSACQRPPAAPYGTVQGTAFRPMAH